MSARRSSASAGSSAAASASVSCAVAAAAAAPWRSRRRAKSSDGAAASASGKDNASAVKQPTLPSASSSLSGHERVTAAAADGSSPAAAASAAPSSDQSTSSASQSKKQRGESSSKNNNGPSADVPANAASASASASAARSQSPGGSKHSSGAAASAGGKRSATAAKPAAPPSAPPLLSGRKRTAAGFPYAAAAAAFSATPSSGQSASSVSQAKKQRGESSSKQRNGSSAAAAAPASSVGLDPLPAPSRRPAASSAAASAASSSAAAQPSSKHDDSGDGKASESDRKAGSRQECQPAAAAASPASASSRRPRKPRAPKPHRLFSVAQGLLHGALLFAKQAGLSADEFESVRDVVVAVRMAVEEPASVDSISLLARLCNVLLLDRFYPKQPSEQTVLRRWCLSADELFTDLASALPQLNLSVDECEALMADMVYLGALQAVPALVRRVGDLPSYLHDGEPLLTWHCNPSNEHFVSMQPYFRLLEFGLDPTETVQGHEPLSALQLARNFVLSHPRLTVQSVRAGPVDLSVEDDEGDDRALMLMEAAVEQAQSNLIPSIVKAQAIQQRERSKPAETKRRIAMHAQDMFALVPAWLVHSTKVRSLLFQAAPGRLIPPLVDIVSRYLDLEGVAPERSAPVEEKAEMA